MDGTERVQCSNLRDWLLCFPLLHVIKETESFISVMKICTDLFEDEAVNFLQGAAVHVAREGLVLGGQTAAVGHDGRATRQEAIIADNRGGSSLETFEGLLREGFDARGGSAVAPIRPPRRFTQTALLIAHACLRRGPAFADDSWRRSVSGGSMASPSSSFTEF